MLAPGSSLVLSPSLPTLTTDTLEASSSMITPLPVSLFFKPVAVVTLPLLSTVNVISSVFRVKPSGEVISSSL